MNTYKVNMSKTVRIITWGYTILLFLCCVVFPIVIMIWERSFMILFSLIFFLVLLCGLSGYAWTLKYIRLTENALVLRKLIGEVRIPYDQIETVTCYKSKGMEVWIFGIGGVGGFIGKFYNKQIGFYTSYVGAYSQAFLIKTKKGKYYMFSCEQREKVVEHLRKFISL